MAIPPRMTWEWIGGVIGSHAIQLMVDSRSSVNVSSHCCQAPLLPLCIVLSEEAKKKVTSPLTESQLQRYRSPRGILSFFLRGVLHGDKEKARTFSTTCENVLTLLPGTFSGTEFMSLFSVCHYAHTIPLKQFHFGLEALDRGSRSVIPEPTVSESTRFSWNKINSQTKRRNLSWLIRGTGHHPMCEPFGVI